METNRNLNGSTAIITGASRGLGASLAHALSNAGAAVALCARSADDLARVAEAVAANGGTVFHSAVDVTDRQQVLDFVAAATEALGPVDILINNAGLGWYKDFEDYSYEELEQVVNVNLLAPMIFSRAVLPGMTARGGGRVLHVASDLSRRVIPKMAPYVAAKHGIAGFAGSLLREVKDKGVQVLTLMPGIMDTWFGGPPGDRESTWAMNPDRVAELAVFMLTQPDYMMTDEVTVHPMHQEL